MSLQLFTTPERMRTVSDIVAEQMTNHIQQGGTYYDLRAHHIAHEAVTSCLPEIHDLLEQRIIVDAEDAVLSHENTGALLEVVSGQQIDGLHVEGVFRTIAVQAFRLADYDDVPNLPIEAYGYDVFAIMKPLFVDPDPIDIVFSNEVYVPFGSVDRFDRVER